VKEIRLSVLSGLYWDLSYTYANTRTYFNFRLSSLFLSQYSFFI